MNYMNSPLVSKVGSGVFYGGLIGAALALVSHYARDQHRADVRKQILDRFPKLSNYSFIIDHIAKIHGVAATQDIEFLGDRLSRLVSFDQNPTARSMQSNRVAEQCIARFRKVVQALRFSRNVDHRLIAEELHPDDFAQRCRDVVHNIILKSSKV